VLVAVLLAAVLLGGCSEDESAESAGQPSESVVTAPAAEIAEPPTENNPPEPIASAAPAHSAADGADAPYGLGMPALEPLPAPQPAEQEPPEQSPEVAPAASDEAEALPRLGIIIDDVGNSRSAGERIIALPAPVALAIMPFTRNAQALATLAAEAGKPVMLHLPMENLAGLAIGEGGLSTRMSRADFEAQLQASLNAFTPVQGVNNHMGSKLTADRERMDWLMTQLAARQLFFVDSRTTKETQAAFAAQAAGVPSVSRDVFLDNERTQVELDREFRLALERARKQGAAVLIGHPYPETLAFLERQLPGLEMREGVRLVSVQALLRQPH